MALPKDHKPKLKPVIKMDNFHSAEPEWTTGLKRLYDSVLDEPLPDSFKDLLSKLDENAGK